jgi:hypothetical protein
MKSGKRGGPSFGVVAAVVVTVMALAATAYVLIGVSSGDETSAGNQAALSSSAAVDAAPGPRTTYVSLLVGGRDKAKIDPRVFDIVAAGVPWSEITTRVFPGDELDVVMIYQEDQGLSKGISAEADPANVDELWRTIGQPNRKRPLYIAQIGDERSPKVEAWLREKLMSLGFELTSNRSKARESLMFTVQR